MSGRHAWLIVLAAALLTPTVTAPTAAANWNQYRGDGTGHSDEKGLPTQFGENTHLAWKTALPGRGWSSPIVQDGKVWMTTALEAEKSLRLLGVDQETGRLRYDVEVFRPASWQAAHPENSYASPTPVAEPGRVCVYFGTYGTACLDTADARILWKIDDLPQVHEVGPASSPILWRDLLIVNCDATDSQFVIARDKRTGKVAWKTERRFTDERKPPHRKAFSTPIVVEAPGRPPQLISTGATHTSAYDPTTGRELWFLRHEGYSNVPMPILGEGVVYLNSGFIRPKLLALRLGRQGDVASDLLWSYDWQVPTNPTPLLIGQRLFLMGDWGIATWLNAQTGEDIWRERLEGKFYASPLHAEDHVYVWGTEGKIWVLKAADQFQIVAESHIEGRILATPAIADAAIFIRSDQALYRFQQSKDAD